MNACKTYNVDSYHIRHPASIFLAGVSMSGKSVFCKRVIEAISEIFYPTPTKIIISFSQEQPLYAHIKHKNLTLVKGLNFDIENHDNEPTLIVLDDQMRTTSDSGLIQDLFTKGVHHNNTSLMYISQNLYNQGKYARDMRLNSHYFIIFKSPTFLSQVQLFGRQIFPKYATFLEEAYKKATEKPYSYLFVDLHPNSEDDLRVKSGILPEEETVYYLPK